MTLELEAFEEKIRNKKERSLEIKFERLRKERGLEHLETISAAFDLLDVWIGNYKLDRTNELLEELVPICREKGGELKTKAIQSKAFVNYKQQKFKEALEGFLEMRELVGPSSALLENTAHTYNSLGDYDKAKQAFSDALWLLKSPSHKNPNVACNEAGIRLGLGLVLKRLNRPAEGIPHLFRALYLYEKQNPSGRSSLIAKAKTSCGRILQDMKEYDAALDQLQGALEIFRVTCGEFVPLTVDCAKYLGSLYVEMSALDARFRVKARECFCSVLHGEVNLDTLRPKMLLEVIQNMLALDGGVNAVPPRTYPSVEELSGYRKPVTAAITLWASSNRLPMDGVGGVFFQFAAQVAVLSGAYEVAVLGFEKAIMIMARQTGIDCTSLIMECDAWEKWAKNKIDLAKETS